ncbi:PEPxxWA-CTERM sorting domain-containing protein [Phenylobacterium sp. LjRoot164]
MKRLIAITAAIAAIATAAPAWAAKVFTLDNVTLQGGGTLTGSFTTNDALTSLLAVDITASAAGAFSQFTYNNASLADWVSLPSQGFRISTAGYAQQLRLDFFPLTEGGANLLSSSYEFQSTGGPRTVTGGRVVLDVPSAVPEPATWAMMIMGFGLAGAALRSHGRKAVLVAA